LAPPPQCYGAIRAALHAHAPIASEYRGPCYCAPMDIPPLPGATLVTQDNMPVLEPWFVDLLPELNARQPVAAVLERDVAVAACFCARITVRAAEAGVETVPAFRGRGYAAAAVAAWAAALRRRGRLPLYSTSWENLASQGVARKLGMQHYGEDWSIG
jgi:hypothetical protein